MSFDQLLERNRAFLAGRRPTPLPAAGSIPHLILACYDPRLDALLRAAFGLDQEDAFLVRSAGAAVMPAGDPLRSIALAVYLFDVKSIVVAGHTSCRMATFDTAWFIDAFRARGVRRDAFGDDDLRAWAGAIADPRRGVQASVAVLRAAACLPRDLEIGGVVLDDTTGALDVAVRPDDALPGAPARLASPEPVAGAHAGGPVEREASVDQETDEAREEPEKRHVAKEPRRVTASAGAPASPDVVKLLSAAGALVQALEAQAVWRHEVRRLRSELHAERNPLARVRLVDAFVRKAVAESREVAAALDRLKREAQAARVPLDEGLLLDLVRRALMGEKS